MVSKKIYKYHGYLEVFPLTIGFITPVFRRGNQLFLEVLAEDKIEEFVELPSDYTKLLKIDTAIVQENMEVMIGSSPCYAFKLENEIFCGQVSFIADLLIALKKRQVLPSRISHLADSLINHSQLYKKKTSIMIVDDHSLIRESYAYILKNQEGYEVVASVDNGEDALKIARATPPDVILLDINMAPLNGFAVMKAISVESIMTRVIAVTMHSQPAYAKEMFALGGRGYVTKNSSTEELLLAIEEVIKGNEYICKHMKMS